MIYRNDPTLRIVGAHAAALLITGAAFGQQSDQATLNLAKSDQPLPATPQTPPPQSAATLDQPESPWSISFEPAAWFVGPSGNIKLPHSPSSAVPNDKTDVQTLNLDNPRFVPFGELNVRKGDWRLAVRGFVDDEKKEVTGISGQIGDVAYSPADTISNSVRLSSFELQGAYTFAGRPLNPRKDGSYAIDTKLDVVGGVRLYDVSWDIRNLGGGSGPLSEHDSGLFVLPEAGLKLNMDFARDFTVDLQVTLGAMPGGSNSAFAGDILVGFQYHPTAHVGVQIGYRSLFFSVQKGSGQGEFSYSGAMQGLYGGLVIRF